MRIRRIGQLTRRSANRALDGAGRSGDAHVDQILSAATAPASSFELNREAEMVALYRFIGAQDVGVAPSTTLAQRLRARLAAAHVGVAVGAVVLLAGGGVAFAASTGNLPEVLGGDHRSPTGAAHSSQAPGQQRTDGPNGPNGPKATSTASATPKGTPSPSLKGLCSAFQAGTATNPGKALDNPAFTALATAAGGKANMVEFCVDLIGAPTPKPGNGPTSEPTYPVPPTKSPNPNKPTKTPAGKISTPPAHGNPN